MLEQSQPAAAAARARAPIHAGGVCFIIDDDAGFCRALSFTLKKLGLGTAELATPAALEAVLAEHNPSLVFLDLGLGQSGAMDIIPILAQHGYDGPVQLMSGRSQSVLDQFVTAGERHGLKMLPALVKPFRMGVIKDVIAKLGLAPPSSAAN